MPTLVEPVPEAHSSLAAQQARVGLWTQWARAAMLLVAAIFFGLHFAHLRADFPNDSPWMDWAKYTDEGWYGDAAIRHYQLGHWYVPGDFNPAAVMPVWPLLELALFRATGVSLAAARALTVVIFGFVLACTYLLIRRWPGMWGAQRDDGEAAATATSLAPAIAVLLLAVSPFCFAFMRMAVLEPLLVLETLAALLAASAAAANPTLSPQERGDEDGAPGVRKPVKKWHTDLWVVLLGVLLPVMVLTKTTGVFLFPAIFWMLWASCGYRVRPFLRVTVPAAVLGAALWGAFYGLFVRPHFLLDYRYLFAANGYTGITPATLVPVLHDTLFDGAWIGVTLFWTSVAAMVGAIVALCVPRVRVNPLVVALLLWVLGYAAFLAYHDNLQPRYYLVLAIPLTMLAAIAFDAVLAGAIASAQAQTGRAWLLRTAALVGGGALVFAGVHGARQTVSYVAHPEYTFLSAANRVHDEVEREARASGHSPLLLSISGSDISLMTGLHSICDDFGTMTLSDRIATYKPGWFASWNYVEDDKMEALAPMYRLVRVGAFPAYDDPDRNLLILYRLDLVGQPVRGVRGRRRSLSVPHRLRTPVGEQPTVKQLSH